MNVFADMNRRLGGDDPFADRQPARSADDGCPPPLPDEAYAPFTEPAETDAGPREPPGGKHKAAPRVIRPEPDRVSAFFSAATLQGCEVPERQWLVPELVPCRSVTLLYGDGGTGKSLLAQQLAVCVAIGSRWLGRDTAAGKAVFLSAEDEKDELHRRLADIARHEAVEFADMDKLTLRSLAGEDALLARAEGPSSPLVPSALCDELDALLGDLQPALLVLDTLADLFPGNENDKAQVRQFMGILKGLAIRHDCALVVLAHPSRAGMATGSGDSGNVAWSASARARLYFEKQKTGEGHEENPDARVLRSMKSNYGPTGQEIPVTWRSGVFVVDAPEAGLDRVARLAKAERVFLSLLRTFTEQGRWVSASPSNTFAPTVFADHPKAEGITAAAFKGAMNALFDRGEIVVAEHGKGAKTRKHIAFAER